MRPLSRFIQHYGHGEIFSNLVAPSRMCMRHELNSFRPRNPPTIQGALFWRAHFSTSKRMCETNKNDASKPISQPRLLNPENVEPAVRHVPEEDLPSHREAQRWTFSKRTHALMDDLMQKLSVAGQEINKYTGTDYTPIEALRQEIKEQEQLVRARQKTVQSSKTALDASLDQRNASQKSVVALLERKSSWSGSDLDSYMSLIRSEHAHDQAVEASKSAVIQAEQALEEARVRLEKRERAQYHEEQIWSDTIRRNSSWVTFGLMGLNIVLLLANLVAIEPWRRKMMVKEIKGAMKDEMDAKELTKQHDVLAVRVEEAASTKDDAILEAVSSTKPAATLEAHTEQIGAEVEQPAAIVFEIADTPSEDAEILDPEEESWVKSYMHNPFSEQLIAIRQMDLTIFGLQAASAGMLVTCAIVFILTID